MLYVLVARSSFQKETNTVAFANQPGNLVLHLDRQMPHGLHAFVRELIALGRGRVLHSCLEYVNEPHADKRALQRQAHPARMSQLDRFGVVIGTVKQYTAPPEHRQNEGPWQGSHTIPFSPSCETFIQMRREIRPAQPTKRDVGA